MKKSIIILFIGLSFFLVTGCEKEENEVISNNEVVNTDKMVHKHCEREGSMEDGEVSLQYEIYYTGEVLNLLIAEEKVMSAKEETLNTYEEAYKGIHAHYEGLAYYDTEVIRGDTTVTSKITINYDKINIQNLIAIEGEEDNIFEDGVPKVDKWLELAKKFGTKCSIVEE